MGGKFYMSASLRDLHVLPKGYTRTRRFGGWSNVRRDQYLELFAKQLGGSEIPLSEDAMDFGPFDSQERDEGEVDLGPESFCLLYTSPSPRDRQKSRMPSSA